MSNKKTKKKKAALEALQQVADKETVKSAKQTILAYILIIGVRGPSLWRRASTLLVWAALTGAMMHWHVIHIIYVIASIFR